MKYTLIFIALFLVNCSTTSEKVHKEIYTSTKAICPKACADSGGRWTGLIKPTPSSLLCHCVRKDEVLPSGN